MSSIDSFDQSACAGCDALRAKVRELELVIDEMRTRDSLKRVGPRVRRAVAAAHAPDDVAQKNGLFFKISVFLEAPMASRRAPAVTVTPVDDVSPSVAPLRNAGERSSAALNGQLLAPPAGCQHAGANHHRHAHNNKGNLLVSSNAAQPTDAENVAAPPPLAMRWDQQHEYEHLGEC